MKKLILACLLISLLSCPVWADQKATIEYSPVIIYEPLDSSETEAKITRLAQQLGVKKYEWDGKFHYLIQGADGEYDLTDLFNALVDKMNLLLEEKNE